MLRFNRLALLVSLSFTMGANAQNLGHILLEPVTSALDAPLFYQLILGEMNAREGDAATAYALMLDAAKKTKSAALFQRVVEIALQARSGASALQAAQAWKQALPQSKEANSFLFQILIGLNRTNETLEPLIQELEWTPESARAAFIASIPQYFGRTNDKKLAALVVEKALTKYLLNPAEASAAWTSIGRMKFEAKEFGSAIEAIRKAQTADPKAVEPVQLSLLMMRSNVPEAEALIMENLSVNPTPRARMDYARALLNTQRFTEAKAQLQIVTSQHSDFAEAWLIQGVLQIQQGEQNSAEQSLKHYLSLVQAAQKLGADVGIQGMTQAYLSLAQIAEQRENYADADAWLSLIENKDDLLNARLRRAVLLAKQGKVADSLKLIRAQHEGSEAETRLKMSTEVQILRDDKQYAAAYEILHNAIDRTPSDWDLVYDMAMIAEKMGNMAEMERLLRSIMISKPDYHHAYNALGYSLAERNSRLPEARQLILKALDYAKDDPFIMDSLGWVEFRSNNLEGALRILKSAFLSKPDAEIAAHLGEVLWTAGQHQNAIGVWKEGSLLNPKNETLLETLKRLRVKW